MTETPHRTTLLKEGAPPHEVRGVVVDLMSETPVEAEIHLDENGPSVHSHADGLFAFTNVSSGQHILRTRRLGFTVAEDTLELGSHAGVALRVEIGRRTVVEAPPLVIQRQKPWWKFW
jgi:hypothetical protein